MKLWTTAALITCVTGCSTIIGADDIVLTEDDDSSAGAGAGMPATATGNSVSSASTSGGGMTGAMGLADGAFIGAVALYQGTERMLMNNGMAISSDIPIVAGRRAVVRVFYSTDANYNGQAVVARLSLGNGRVFEASGVLGGSSQSESLSSTLNISIDGDALSESTSYQVELLQPESSTSNTNGSARYPAQGLDSLPVQQAGEMVKLVLVPIRYQADNSNRLPDTSDAQIELYRNTFYKLYPVKQVSVAVTGAINWASTVAPNGSGWGDLLNALISFRQSNGAANDEYYYGIFRPKETFGNFCGGGCVAGLSVLAGPNDAMGRAGIGLGFSGEAATETAAHEVGHQHGRSHAPCQTFNGLDPQFPYSDGGIGALGYDLVKDVLKLPSQHSDFMGYCNPTWVSDYQFRKLFERIKFVNGADMAYPNAVAPQLYNRITVEFSTGRATPKTRWLDPISLPTPPTGESLELTLKTGSGLQRVKGRFLRYTHIEGGILLFPKLASGARVLTAAIDGHRIHLARPR